MGQALYTALASHHHMGVQTQCYQIIHVFRRNQNWNFTRNYLCS